MCGRIADRCIRAGVVDAMKANRVRPITTPEMSLQCDGSLSGTQPATSGREFTKGIELGEGGGRAFSILRFTLGYLR